MTRMRTGITGAAAIAAAALVACEDAPSPAALTTDLSASADAPLATIIPSYCDQDLRGRPPAQVLEDHRAALADGDVDAAVCNFATDATVIADGGIDRGHEEIRASLEFFLTLFGGTQPVVVQELSTEILNADTHMVRLLFTIDAGCVIVPDGIDTYVIQRGLIRAQTSHAFPVFTCVP